MTLPLRAGPLSLLFDSGMIRSVRYGDIEIVRRVYMALRDENWNTIPYTVSGLTVEQYGDSFKIRFDARHLTSGIDFRWHSEFTGSAEGRIALAMDGEALRDCKRNRIGWCVLHPLALCKDAPCLVEHSGGLAEQMRFPGCVIAAHQPFFDVRAMTYDVEPGVACAIRFDGDVFETEDQRNWTDGSFKSYSTPQSLPVPVNVVAGERVRQAITISLTGQVSIRPTKTDRPVAIDVEQSFDAAHAPLRIGLRAAPGRVLTKEYLDKVRFLGCSYVRFDCTPGVDDVRKVFGDISSICDATGTMAEVALHLSPDYSRELDIVAQAVCCWAVPVCRWLIIRADAVVTPTGTLEAARKVLGRHIPSATVSAGTNRYFVEINRAPPSPELFDALWFSATPQVHTSDNCSIMENIEGLVECITYACTVAKGKPVVISPLTLRPRHDPSRPLKSGGVDERQQQLFGAAWLTGAIAAAVVAGLDALTCCNAIVGDEGVMGSEDEGLFPLYQVLASGVCGAKALTACLLGRDGPVVAVLRWDTASGVCMLAANLSEKEQPIAFKGLQLGCDFALLDESTIGRAAREIRFWEIAKQSTASDHRGTLSFTMPPNAVARISQAANRLPDNLK